MDWKNFMPIFRYSLAILAMGVFQLSAASLRPIILSIFSKSGVGIVAEYRIMETITIFVISIGGMAGSIFLPKTSQIVVNNDRKRIERFAYEGTRYTTIISVFLCFTLLLSSRDIITLYVGAQFEYLSNWLNLWLLTILLLLHNSPISSLVLATGNTRMLVYSSAFACILSVTVNAMLSNYLGVGSAVVGYAIYILLQISFYYCYFNSRVLGLNSVKVFVSFLYPALLGGMVVLIIYIVDVDINNLLVRIIFKSLTFILFYTAALLLTNVINIQKMREMFLK
jgi:O-antigen/teichoic acid export membrane protein